MTKKKEIKIAHYAFIWRTALRFWYIWWFCVWASCSFSVWLSGKWQREGAHVSCLISLPTTSQLALRLDRTTGSMSAFFSFLPQLWQCPCLPGHLWTGQVQMKSLSLSVPNSRLLCQWQRPLCPQRHGAARLHFLCGCASGCCWSFSGTGKCLQLINTRKNILQNRCQLNLHTMTKLPTMAAQEGGRGGILLSS